MTSIVKRTRSGALLGTLALSFALGACATTKPSQQLVDARTAYEQTANGPAKEVVPVDVLTARQALDRAEAAFNEDPGSLEERSLAYIAKRKAALASVHAEKALAEREMTAAEQAAMAAREKMREQAETELERTRSELEGVRAALDAQGNRLSERTSELREKESMLEERMNELKEERKARREAEAAAAAAMASLERVAQVTQEDRGTVITLSGSVLFESGDWTLRPVAKDRLDSVAEALKSQGKDKQIVVEGHTDSRGTDFDNMRLSEARANAVLAYLVQRGIDAARISAVGKGENRPIAPNDTPEGRANNRRVEIILKPSS